MRIVEIFNSIQGEGRFVGTPSTFVRFAGCGLRCQWCDSKFAWRHKTGQGVTAAAIAREVSDKERTYVVLTGGEPLEQPHKVLAKLVRLLCDQGRIITIETNATIEPPLQLIRHVALLSLSPKLSSAKLQDPPDWKQVVAGITRMVPTNKVQIKFVIADEQDVLEAAEYARGPGELLHYILQPEGYQAYAGSTRAEALEHYMNAYQHLVALAREHFPIDKVSVQILPQLHVLAWGRQRGV